MSKGEAILPANRQSVPTTSRNCPINGIVRSTIGPRANYWFDFSMKLAEGQASAGRNLDGSRYPGKRSSTYARHATESPWKVCEEAAYATERRDTGA